MFQMIHDVIPAEAAGAGQAGARGRVPPLPRPYARLRVGLPLRVGPDRGGSARGAAGRRTGASRPTWSPAGARVRRRRGGRRARSGPPCAPLAEPPFVLCVGTDRSAQERATPWSRPGIGCAQDLGVGMPRLVLAGQRGWRTEDRVRPAWRGTGNLGGTVVVAETPTDAELAFLYRHCLFTVFPSLYEGWACRSAKACGSASSASPRRHRRCRRSGRSGGLCRSRKDDEGLQHALLRALQESNYISAREQRISAGGTPVLVRCRPGRVRGSDGGCIRGRPPRPCRRRFANSGQCRDRRVDESQVGGKMKVAIVAPSSVPFTIGGAENLWLGLLRYINKETRHDAELIKMPSPERTFVGADCELREFLSTGSKPLRFGAFRPSIRHG